MYVCIYVGMYLSLPAYHAVLWTISFYIRTCKYLHTDKTSYTINIYACMHSFIHTYIHDAYVDVYPLLSLPGSVSALYPRYSESLLLDEGSSSSERLSIFLFQFAFIILDLRYTYFAFTPLLVNTEKSPYA